MLLQALADCPVVAARRIDAEPGAASPWHELGRVLLAHGSAIPANVGVAVHLVEFGRMAIVTDGAETRPRITKTYMLLAYLFSKRGRSAKREELLDALFDARDDNSTRAYLRQAVNELRRVVDRQDAIVVEGGAIRIADDVHVSSDTQELSDGLREAARLQGGDRLAGIRQALALAERGEYLPGTRSEWVDERRRELHALVNDARQDAAELAFAGGEYAMADELAVSALDADPYQESAWRLRMRVANALGDDDRVLAIFDGCRAALARLGASPSPTTRQLLERLQR